MPNQKNKAEWVEGVVNRYEGPLIRYTLKLIGNIEKAREIVQETFLKLWKVERKKIEGYLSPWLFKLCRNLALDILRREKKMENVDNEQILEDRSQPDLAEEIHKHNRVKDMKEAIKLLSQRQQEVLILKFQNDLSYKEISEITGLSTSNVGYLIHEGVQNLRRHLGNTREVI